MPAATITHIPHWIGGKTQLDGTSISVLNPATGESIAQVPQADHRLVESAVAVARAAFKTWSELTVSRRASYLYTFRLLLQEHADELVEIITAENGKTLDDARGELQRGIDSVELAVAAPFVLKGEYAQQTGRGIDTFTALHPLGVCIGVTPFNFPAMIPLGMLSVAIAAGNTFILKPSEQNPSVAVRIAELASEAGIPDGVFNVVQGGRETVESLIDHPDTAAVSFVGSTAVAHTIYKRAADAGKRVQAFGGAKNHLLVAPDANLDAAADALSSAAFGSAGQRCMAVTVAVAVGDIADELVEKLAQRAHAIVMGDGADPGVEMGPLISEAAQRRVRGLVERALAAGAVPVVNRSAEIVAGHENGHFVGPTILDHVRTDSEIYLNEAFGPVLSVVRVGTADEGLDLIRRHRYGNGAAIFTRSGELARRFQHEASAGMVGINVSIPVPVAHFGAAGWKDSVFGDTGLNNGAWRFYTQPKHITTRWDEATTGVDFGFRPN